MAVLIELIKRLREETGAGVSDCRKALEEANGNVDLALVCLRQWAEAEAARRANHQASEGRIELYSHGSGRVGVMLEINTETSFAGHSEVLRSFAHELVLQIAAAAPRYVRDEDIPGEVLAEETRQAAQRARSQGKAEPLIPRIVEGMLKKFKDEQVLLRQAYIRDESLTIAQLLAQTAATLGENVVIQRFMRWELAEGQ
jgi:elongation factor Ts